MNKKQTSGKTTPKKKVKKFTKSKPLPKLEDLDHALYEMERYFEQVHIPFFLRGNTLATIKDKEQVDGRKIELGVVERYLTKEVRSFFKGWGFSFSPRRIKINIREIPVEVKILKRRPKWLEHPDTTWYKVTQFNTPNPWRAGL